MQTFAMISGNLLGGIVVLICGLVIRTGKANFLIAGYNTASKEEQAKWNMEKMPKFIGHMLIASAAVLLLGCGFVLFESEQQRLIALGASWILFTIIILAGVAYLNLNSRFKL